MKWILLAIGLCSLVAMSAFAERPWRASDSIERARIGVYAPAREATERAAAPQKRTIICTLTVSYLLPRYICKEE